MPPPNTPHTPQMPPNQNYSAAGFSSLFAAGPGVQSGQSMTCHAPHGSVPSVPPHPHIPPTSHGVYPNHWAAPIQQRHVTPHAVPPPAVIAPPQQTPQPPQSSTPTPNSPTSPHQRAPSPVRSPSTPKTEQNICKLYLWLCNLRYLI